MSCNVLNEDFLRDQTRDSFMIERLMKIVKKYGEIGIITTAIITMTTSQPIRKYPHTKY